MLRDPIVAYADSVERRVGMTGIMHAWACNVLAALETQFDTARMQYFIQPTLFGDVRDNMRIAQEEIFGPMQCCMPWRDADEVSTMLLDDCSNPLYRLIADDEARVRTVIRDLVNT